MRVTIPLLIAVSLCLTSFAFCGPARHVLLISVDGLRPDALMQADAPVIKSLMKRGAYSLEAQTTLPSVTLTSHTSMMTGVPPLRHHVLWNDWQPEKGRIETQTIFDVAKAAGLTTAMFAGKDKFRHFEIPGRFDEFSVPGYPCQVVADAAVRCIVERQPALIMVHLAEPDGAGHSKGWMGPEYMEAIARADRAVGRLLAALDSAKIADSTAIIVSADHGGHEHTHGSAMAVDMTIPWIAAGAGVRAVGKLRPGIVTTDTAATVVALLGLAVPATWEGRPVTAALEPVSASARERSAAAAR